MKPEQEGLEEAELSELNRVMHFITKFQFRGFRMFCE